MNFMSDYSEYKLDIKYYLIKNIDNTTTLEKEITEDEYIEWSNTLSINNLNLPFTVKCRYFISYVDSKGEETKPTEVSETIFAEIYKWQHNKKWNLQYELRKHRDKVKTLEDAEIEFITDKRNIVSDTEGDAMENVSKEEIKEFIFKKLPYPQNIRFYKFSIEDKTTTQIAREEHKNKSTISRSINYAKKKLKKFLNKKQQN